jgi:Macrocin-O-methyltransferase (TylF)
MLPAPAVMPATRQPTFAGALTPHSIIPVQRAPFALPRLKAVLIHRRIEAKQGRSIAVLRLDGDWYDSTMLCLEHLFPLVVPGGLMLIDDYYTWDGCARAVHDYLSREQAAGRIEKTSGGVTYIVHRSDK